MRASWKTGASRIGTVRHGAGCQPNAFRLFLHYVLDDWFERDIQPRLKGHSFLIRFADDFVMGFTREEDARKVMDVLPKRLEKYGLTTPCQDQDSVGAVQLRPSGSSGTTRVIASICLPGDFRPAGTPHYWGSFRRGTGW